MTSVGVTIPRLESVAKVTGRAHYAADLAQPGMLHAKLVRSVYPSARVVAVDASAALAVDGVVRVLSALDVKRELPDLAPFDPACAVMERDPSAPVAVGDARLLDDTVRYVGEPVAIVLAETEGAAALGAAAVSVDYDILPAVLGTDAAVADGAPLVHEAAPGNVAASKSIRTGDPERAFAEAAVVVEATFTTSRQKQAQLEPTACLAMLDPDGRIIVWTPHQAPHRARATLASLFGLPLARVRVIVPTVGGAFGKNDALTAEPYAVAAAIVSSRPVRLVYSRQEDFVGTEARHPTRTSLSLALRADGSIAAVRGRIVIEAGAYLSHSAAITGVVVSHMVASYRIEHAQLEASCIFTNSPVSGAFRGYGGPQAALPLEHLIDLGCRRLGVDPLDARMRMRLRPGDPTGYRREPISGDGHRLVLERGAAAIAWGALRSAPPGPSPRYRRGVGMASTAWKSGVVGKSLDHSAATLRFAADGSLFLATAAADLGTGIRTTLAQICAETIGLPVSGITLVENDTDTTPFDSGAFASRSLFRAGQAVHAASLDLRSKLLDYAALKMEIAVDDLEIASGTVSPRGSPDRSRPIRSLLRDALLDGRELVGVGDAPATTAPSFAAVFVEVEVDVETGQVRPLRAVAAQDVGRAINPGIVEGQIQGAVHQGLGYALTEGLVVDVDSGTVLNGTYMDYRLLTSADSPPIDVVLIEEAEPSGPFGARGVAEPAIVVTAPAVANAILDAIGTCPTELPFTPERVLEALREASASASGSVA